MQVKSIAECSPSAILPTFIKLPFVIKISVVLFMSGCFTQVLLYEADIQKNHLSETVPLSIHNTIRLFE